MLDFVREYTKIDDWYLDGWCDICLDWGEIGIIIHNIEVLDSFNVHAYIVIDHKWMNIYHQDWSRDQIYLGLDEAIKALADYRKDLEAINNKITALRNRTWK